VIVSKLYCLGVGLSGLYILPNIRELGRLGVLFVDQASASALGRRDVAPHPDDACMRWPSSSPTSSASARRTSSSERAAHGCLYRRSRALVPAHADHPFRVKAIVPERDAAGWLYFAGFCPFVKSAFDFRMHSPLSITGGRCGRVGRRSRR
jgi:hypothetical protein